MNGITAILLVILAIGVAGLAFTTVRTIDHIETLLKEIAELKTIISAIGEKAESASAKAKSTDMVILEMKKEIGNFKTATNASIGEIRKSVFGTADVDEFSRVKTAAFSADFRSKGLEKVIHSMNGNEIMPRRRKSIQKGLLTVSVADDEKALDAEVRTIDG